MLIFVFLGLNIIASFLAIFIFYKIYSAYHKFTMKKLLSPPALLEDLPSVSVCIPARDEEHAIVPCLERVLACSYPKLEILVLDDHSRDKTSSLVRAFAQDGVRFIDGKPLAKGWLGKNFAVNELLNEASGKYVLFMDVDTHIEPETIGQLVAYVEQETATMVSVLPTRKDSYRFNVIFSSLRYLWDIVFYTNKNCVATSNAWMINRTDLIQLGGLADLKTDTQPETKLANMFNKSNKYRFIISNHQLGLGYEKRWLSQLTTSIRLLYPMFKSSLVYSLIAVLLLAILLVPYILLPLSVFTDDFLLQVISACSVIMMLIVYGYYLRRIRNSGWLVGVLAFPIQIIQEIVLIILSYLAYKTHNVKWKNRPIKY